MLHFFSRTVWSGELSFKQYAERREITIRMIVSSQSNEPCLEYRIEKHWKKWQNYMYENESVIAPTTKSFHFIENIFNLFPDVLPQRWCENFEKYYDQIKMKASVKRKTCCKLFTTKTVLESMNAIFRNSEVFSIKIS